MSDYYDEDLRPLTLHGGLSNKNPTEENPYGLHRDWIPGQVVPGVVYDHLRASITTPLTVPPVTRAFLRAPAGYQRAGFGPPGFKPDGPIFGMGLGHWDTLEDDQRAVMQADLARFLREFPEVKAGPYVLGWASDPTTRRRAREFPLDGYRSTHLRWIENAISPYVDAGCVIVGFDHACFNDRPPHVHHPGDWEWAREGMAEMIRRVEQEWPLQAFIEGMALDGDGYPAWNYLDKTRSIVTWRNFYHSFWKRLPNEPGLARHFFVPEGVEIHVLIQNRPGNVPPDQWPEVEWRHVLAMEALGYVIGYIGPPIALNEPGSPGPDPQEPGEPDPDPPDPREPQEPGDKKPKAKSEIRVAPSA